MLFNDGPNKATSPLKNLPNLVNDVSGGGVGCAPLPGGHERGQTQQQQRTRW